MTYAPLDNVCVLGLTGRARAGKDTLARALIRVLPGAERFAFSDAIAAYARASGLMADRDPKILQDCGWERRQRQPNVWIDALYGSIVDKAPAVAIITGVRFQDEAALVRAMGGVVVRVLRLEPDGSEHLSTDRDQTHAVEREIDLIACDREIQIASGNLVMFDRAAAWLADWLKGLPHADHRRREEAASDRIPA